MGKSNDEVKTAVAGSSSTPGWGSSNIDYKTDMQAATLLTLDSGGKNKQQQQQQQKTNPKPSQGDNLK